MNIRLSSIVLLFIASIVLVSCDEKPRTAAEDEIKIHETFEQRMEREVTAALEIPATERIEMKVYRAFINNDSLKDAIITVNRNEYALNLAIEKKVVAKAEEVGYIGNYNFFFYYDAALDKISIPIPVPSSPGRPLDVHFESITQSVQKDVIIDYRILNSGYKTYYSVVNDHDLIKVFNWDEFSQLGTPKSKATYHSYELSNDGLTKEIVLYEGKVSSIPKGKDKHYYDVVPQIESTQKRLARFFYNPRSMKYAVNMEDAAYLRSLAE